MDKKYFLKLAVLFSGNFCAAFGVFLCAASRKGVDPITVLLDGIISTLGVSIGLSVIILHSILMIICFIFDKKSIKFGTIFSVLTFSLSLNLFMANITHFAILAHLPISWLMLAFGIIFMGVGFSIGIFANIGYNTADIALNIFASRTKFSIKTCKNILDLCYTIIGITLGGRIGIGTILCVIFVGVVYSFTLKTLEKSKSNRLQRSYTLINEII